MSTDSAYPTFQHYGTNAQRLAFTPSPPGTQPIYQWYETDTDTTWIYTTSWHQVSGSGGGVTASGTLTSGQLIKGAGTSVITVGNLTGDVTTSGSMATTLANSGVTAATYGSATAIPVITVDVKGRATTITTATPTTPGLSVFLLAGDINNGHNPADATTYHWGLRPGNNPITGGTDFTAPVVPKTGTVKAVFITVEVRGTLASAGSSTLTLSNITATTTQTVTSALALTSATNTASNTSMSLAVTAGDRLEVTLLTPTWATNPTTVLYSVAVFIEF